MSDTSQQNILIQIGYSIVEQWNKLHNTNINGSPFKIGDKVVATTNNDFIQKGKIYTIAGINRITDEEWEFSLENVPFIYFEYELEKL